MTKLPVGCIPRDWDQLQPTCLYGMGLLLLPKVTLTLESVVTSDSFI